MFDEMDTAEYYRQMNRDMYSGGGKKYKDKEQVWFDFVLAVQYRIMRDFKLHGVNREDFRYYPNLKDAWNRAAEKNHYELKNWYGKNFCKDWSFWTNDEWKSDKGLDVCEAAIRSVCIPFADKITAFKGKSEQKVEKVIEQPKTEVIEPKKKLGRGRPIGSKNKKPAKELFMPANIVKINDGKVDMESFIFAIADLVWRKPGMMDGNYLDLLNLNSGQRKYINKLFMIGSELLVNPYWSFAKEGKITVLDPKRKRVGYYSNKMHKLISLTEISEKTGIPKMTLKDRLCKMSIKDAITK